VFGPTCIRCGTLDVVAQGFRELIQTADRFSTSVANVGYRTQYPEQNRAFLYRHKVFQSPALYHNLRINRALNVYGLETKSYVES
jgi:hypothetical protein